MAGYYGGAALSGSVVALTLFDGPWAGRDPDGRPARRCWPRPGRWRGPDNMGAAFRER